MKKLTSSFTEFSIENFSVFSEKTEFEIRPITILTGENNSGKSSMLKALMLLSESAKNNFGTLSTNDFSVTESKPNQDDFLKFEIKNKIEFDLAILEPIFVKNAQTKQFFDDHKNNEFYYYLDLEYDMQNWLFSYSISISSNYFEKALLYKNTKIKDDEILQYEVEIQEESINKFPRFNFESGVKKEILKKEIFNQSFGDILQSSDFVILSAILMPERFQKNIVNKNEYIKNSIKEIEKIDAFLGLNFLKTYLNEEAKFNSEYSINNTINIWLQIRSFCEIFLGKEKNFFYAIFSIITSDVNSTTDEIKNITFLNKEIYKGRIYNNKNKMFNLFNEVNSRLFNLSEFEKWLKYFEIGDSLVVNKFEEQALVAKIKKNNNVTNINELGSGYLRLVYLLLGCVSKKASSEIHNSISEMYGSLMIIEEPELNLHPNLQSKLADFFVEMTQNYGCQFIIETHSEYLIRRLQFLTATQNIDGDKIAINYVNKPNKPTVISGEEPQVLKIGINSDGSLTQNFPTGFMDMAATLSWDLITFNNHN